MPSATYISIQLPDKAGEIVVLEVIWKQVSRKLGRPPHDEGGVVLPPRHNVISGGVIHEMISLRQEGSGHCSVAIVGEQTGALCAGCIQRQRHTFCSRFLPPKFRFESVASIPPERRPQTSATEAVFEC